jgi:hypothetical protein
MTPNEIILKYIAGEYNGDKKLRKSVVFRMMKSLMIKAAMKFSDVIDLNIESLSDLDPFWTEVRYTFFYVNNKERFYARKSMFLINYIAADYEGFSMGLVEQFISEIEINVKKKIYADDMKNTFMKCLSLNKSLPKEVKLWMKLN